MIEALKELEDEIFDDAEEKGWHDSYYKAVSSNTSTVDVLVSKLALITCEVSEAIEEVRDHGNDTRVRIEDGKPEGLAVELADVVIRTLDLAATLGINLAPVIRQKIDYNKTRPRMHGGKLL